MKFVVKYPVAIAAVFLWIGFVCAISFMEAWLKFKAPGIDLPLGLGIGRLVFQALNKVELVLGVIVIGSLLLSGLKEIEWKYLFFLIPFLIVGLQSVWLLPVLDARAEMYIQGQNVQPSNLHFYYVILEVMKVACLLVFGLKLFEK